MMTSITNTPGGRVGHTVIRTQALKQLRVDGTRFPSEDEYAGPHAGGRPLKVCILAACPFPANHGTPGSIREMAEAIHELGHEVHIVTYHFGEDISVKGPHVHRIPPLTRESAVMVGPTIRRPLYDLQMVSKTLEVIRRHNLDILHAHGYEAVIVAWICRMLTGLPVVYSGHNTMADELPSYHFIRPQWLATVVAKALDAFVPRLADRCLPHSANIERFFHRGGLRERTEPLVPFGIDSSSIQGGDGVGVRQRYELGRDPVVLYAGVLDEFQRLDLLLQALAEVAYLEPRVKLLVVTSIPCEKHSATVRRRAKELGVSDRVVLTDPQPFTALRDFLAAGDVAVVPRPQAPGFPIKLLNYLAARKPCLLFASSASTGLVHRQNALLVVPDTSKALAWGLLELLGDDELRERLARAGYEFVRVHHDRRLMAQRICPVYWRILEGRGIPHLTPAEPWPRV